MTPFITEKGSGFELPGDVSPGFSVFGRNPEGCRCVL